MDQLLKDTFGHFLVKALLDAKCYDSLASFALLLTELAQAGVKMPKVCGVVHNLASAKLTDPKFATDSICKTASGRLLGLETRMTVFSSKLYFDFLAKRTQALLVAAKAAKDKAA